MLTEIRFVLHRTFTEIYHVLQEYLLIFEYLANGTEYKASAHSTGRAASEDNMRRWEIATVYISALYKDKRILSRDGHSYKL